jgi:hypothetical protein
LYPVLIDLISWFTCKKSLHILNDLAHQPLARLTSNPGYMGCNDQVGDIIIDEHIPFRGRLNAKDVKSSASNDPLSQRIP